MKRLGLCLIALFLLFSMTAVVGAQEDSVTMSGKFGSEVTVYPYFADTTWFSLHLDFAGFRISSTTNLSYASPISISQVLGLAYTWNWLTLGSNLYMGIFAFPPSFTSLSVYGEASLFDMPLDGASVSGGIGASATVYPTVTDDVWFDFGLVANGFSLASKTTFSLIPLGFVQQRFDIGLVFDGLSVYVWGAVSGAWDLSGGVGFNFNFP